jgi:hypothetical protein
MPEAEKEKLVELHRASEAAVLANDSGAYILPQMRLPRHDL